MGWFITVEFADGRQIKAAHIHTPSLGPAVESALHEMSMSGARTGSYQITVSNDSEKSSLHYQEAIRDA